MGSNARRQLPLHNTPTPHYPSCPFTAPPNPSLIPFFILTCINTQRVRETVTDISEHFLHPCYLSILPLVDDNNDNIYTHLNLPTAATTTTTTYFKHNLKCVCV